MIKHIDDVWDFTAFVKKIVWYAVSYKASDIHITPLKENILIRFRVAWDIISFCSISHQDNIKLTNVIKIASWMDINENQNPQDGKYILEVFLEKKPLNINLRVSTFPSLYWENVVMRVAINSISPIPMEELWFHPVHVEKMHTITQLNSWLVLVAGETWSWKTSTLYSLLRTFDPFEKTIYTLEDPIEYVVDGFVQSEVKHKWEQKNDKYSFKKWLVWLLRQDPDIILIWEVRDNETASICLESANTWHLIFWSIHANDWLSVITRLQQLWVENYLISSGLKNIIFQKLTKKLCSHCKKKKKIKISDYTKTPAKENDEVEVWVSDPFWCEMCYKWYKWLQLIGEIIHIDDELAQLIYHHASQVEMKNYLKKSWHISLFQDAFVKSQKWLVSFDEIISLK